MKSSYSECDLAAMLFKQNQQAFNYLYDHYSASLYGVILKIVTKEEIAEDLLQEVFIKIWKNLKNYDADKERLFTWLLHITRNTCFDYLRAHRHEMLDLSTVGKLIEDNQNIFPNMNNNDLKELISQLKKGHKLLIRIVYWEGLPLVTVKTSVYSSVTI